MNIPDQAELSLSEGASLIAYGVALTSDALRRRGDLGGRVATATAQLRAAWRAGKVTFFEEMPKSRLRDNRLESHLAAQFTFDPFNDALVEPPATPPPRPTGTIAETVLGKPPPLRLGINAWEINPAHMTVDGRPWAKPPSARGRVWIDRTSFAAAFAPAASVKQTALAPARQGRSPKVDWDAVRKEQDRLFEYHGEFSDDDPQWNCQARLEEQLIAYCVEKQGKPVSQQTVRRRIGRWKRDRSIGS